ncbi:MAG: ribonuclease E/G, partial [Mycolicibacterium sp.]|nr:ribonuclease E/G [Mycolicibacterium sp.]
MADDDLTQDLPESPLQWQPPATDEQALPERLRVHTLARALGTTSRRVLDALTRLDGRSRSAQSSVDQADALRVREVLAAEPADGALAAPGAEAAPVAEIPAEEPPAYMPLFVAPPPVVAARADQGDRDADGNDDDDPDSGDDDTADVDSADRPANRRRRRGRRGRGRGRGEAGGEGEDDDS